MYLVQKKHTTGQAHWGIKNLLKHVAWATKVATKQLGIMAILAQTTLFFINHANNLYAGLRYGRSDFKDSTTPASPTEQITSKNLTASWWELAIGSEHQLFSSFGLDAGLVVHLKSI